MPSLRDSYLDAVRTQDCRPALLWRPLKGLIWRQPQRSWLAHLSATLDLARADVPQTQGSLLQAQGKDPRCRPSQMFPKAQGLSIRAPLATLGSRSLIN